MVTKRVLSAGLLAILALVFACAWLTGRVDWEYVVEKLDGGTHTRWQGTTDYAFDPRVVSSTLPIGDFLTPVPPGTPFPTSEPRPDLAVLDEEVFRGIASKLAEEQEGLRLISVSFGSPCAYAGSGLQGMYFEYIKRRDNAGGFPYLYVGLDVDLDRVRCDTYEMTAAAPEARWPVVDYDRLDIKALEALRIAEDNGGRDFRNEVDNACIIYGVLLEDGAVWKVRYRIDGEQSAAVCFEINARTGEVITIER